MTSDLSDQQEFLLDYFQPQTEAEDERRIARRAAYFSQSFPLYRGKLKQIGLNNIRIDNVLLANCIESYFVDIRRVKHWHGMERADRFKIAAYTFKWLTKTKPIQVGDTSSANPAAQKQALLINPDFAAYHALIISRINIQLFNKSLLRRLLYMGHYRDIEEGGLAMLLESWAGLFPCPLGKKQFPASQ